MAVNALQALRDRYVSRLKMEPSKKQKKTEDGVGLGGGVLQHLE